MTEPSTTKPLSKVTYEGVEIPLPSGGGDTVRTGTIGMYINGTEEEYEIKAEDLAGVYSIPEQFFAGHLITKLELPNSLELLEDGAFDGILIEEIVIPDSVVEMYGAPFSNCENLVRAKLSKNLVGSVWESPFAFCPNLETVEIPEGITIIPPYCFETNNYLVDVVLPSTIEEILMGAFDMGEYEYITILATTPPELDPDVFSPALTTVYVPYGCASAYQNDTNWAELWVENGGNIEFVELNPDGTKPQ